MRFAKWIFLLSGITGLWKYTAERKRKMAAHKLYWHNERLLDVNSARE